MEVSCVDTTSNVIAPAEGLGAIAPSPVVQTIVRADVALAVTAVYVRSSTLELVVVAAKLPELAGDVVHVGVFEATQMSILAVMVSESATLNAPANPVFKDCVGATINVRRNGCAPTTS